MFDLRQKIGILVGLTIIGFASWMHSLSKSERFADWFPGLHSFVTVASIAGPFIVFIGAYLLFLSITRRMIISAIIAVPFAVFLALMLWI